MTDPVTVGTSKIAPILRSSSRDAVIASAAMVVADLDQTLAFTKHAHMALIHSFMRGLNTDIPDESISQRYSELRGRAYSDILEGMRDLHNARSVSQISSDDFKRSFFEFSRQYKVDSDAERAIEIGGARELLLTVRQMGTPLIVCTGSPRPLAERFLAEAGVADLVESRNLYCWGDTEYSKADAEFWVPILDGIDRQNVIALDDHPHSAEYLLKVAKVGAAFVLPSVGTEKFRDLESEFPGRIVIIEKSWANWS
jgi:beta-phosphoglucomutase-like phosphatase (HAD superfamily)